MRLITVALLLLSTVTALGGDYDEVPPPVTCEARCLRIHERSLERIGFSKAGADRFIDKLKPEAKKLRDVCWKQFDYFYCLKGCAKSVDHEKHVRHVRNKCKHVVEDLEPGISCLFKYRSFLEIRCSSFLNEAVRLEQADDPDLLPDKETCRYLHLNALCLENSVSSFCPQATPFFRRLNLREYFLNHILPQDDELFDDQDLDACQMKDFVKEALEGVKVSPKQEENEENATTVPIHSSTSSRPISTTTLIDYDDEDGDTVATVSPPSTPAAIVRTLSPSTRVHPQIQTSTTSNFVYTTPTRKHSSSTIIGTSTTPIHITKEQAMRTSTTRGERTEGRITVRPKSPTTTTAKPTTRAPSTTTSRRRIFESEEDFSQTPPNFLWGSFRGENYKVARNYSESFPPNAEFVTPVTIESSSTFGEDGDTADEDYGRPLVVDIDRGLEPVTVTGRPVKLSTIVSLIDEKSKKATGRKKGDEDHSSPIYEHAVDTQLQPTTPLRPLTLHSEEELTTIAKVLPTDFEGEEEKEEEEEERDEENKKEEEKKQLPVDENDIKYNELTEEEIREEINASLRPDSRGFDTLPVVDVLNEKHHKEEAENNYDRALQIEKEEDDPIDIEPKPASEELLNLKPAVRLTTTMLPELFTPLINGGRVAVKSIKKFRTIGEDSGQDWTEDRNLDDSHVDVGDADDYDKEVYVTSEILPDESRDSNVRRRINFILAYSALFFLLLLLVISCIMCVIVRNRRNAHINRPYKMHDTL